MKSSIYTEERRKEILSLLQRQKRVSVNELNKLYQVSGTTIRLDLAALEKKGLLVRTHGGAVLPESSDLFVEPVISERHHEDEKSRIAKAALNFLVPDETILLDTGTTLSNYADIFCRNVSMLQTVYSNDLHVLQILESSDSCELHMLGGKIRSGFHYSYGTQVINEMSCYHFKKFFLATSAFSMGDLTTTSSDLAALKRSMIDASEQVILLVDSSKFDIIGFQKFADLSDIDVVFTDTGIDYANLKYLQEHVKTVITA